MKAAVVAAALLLLAAGVAGDCTCDAPDSGGGGDAKAALPLKLAGIFCILFSSAVGCAIPTLGRRFPFLAPDTDLFYVVKAFAAGVILATAFVHILPDAFDQLTSPCLPDGSPWRSFPFAGLIAMLAAICTLIVDTVATGYFRRMHKSATAADPADAESHGHATHAHGAALALAEHGGGDGLVRHRVIAEVLELGIITHSVIIGITLGANDNVETIRPLVAALVFHQFFEGMGLGGCIVKARFKASSVVIMAAFFALTTPVGVAIGIGIASAYNESSPTALAVEGTLDSAAAGILVYMALVDLLAEDFLSSKVQGSGRLQLLVNVALLLGAALMSILAIWA